MPRRNSKTQPNPSIERTTIGKRRSCGSRQTLGALAPEAIRAAGIDREHRVPGCLS